MSETSSIDPSRRPRAGRPRVIAHRGVHHTGAVENTLEAFELAVAAGADMIELDVRRTGDEQLVILHDHGKAGAVLAEGTLDDFERRTGLRPPRLQDVLDWADGRIALDVELKEDGYVEEVAPMLQAFARAGNELIVTSFIDPLLTRLSELAPELSLGLLVTLTARRAAERARAVGAGTVLPEMKLVTESLMTTMSEADLRLIVWDFTVSDDDRRLMSDPRVTAVITDDVPAALSARGRAGPRGAERG